MDEELFCEEVRVSDVADAVGTPFYLYSHATLTHHFRVFDSAFEEIPHLVCFSVKANSNLAILKLFADLGGGADIVSGGELFRSLKAGIEPQKIVFSGVGKTPQEMREALDAGILMFNVESAQELDLLNTIAGQMGKVAPVSIRVNPDVDPKTHPYISTGLKKNKFGIELEDAIQEYFRTAELENLEVVGISCHIGSQLTEVDPFVDSFSRVKDLVARLREEGIDISYLDLGGGLGITYSDEEPPHPDSYAKRIIQVLKELYTAGVVGAAVGNGLVHARPRDLTLILEPGRVIVGNAGILVTRVLYNKEGVKKRFIIVDAAMNDLARPALYDSYHRIMPVTDPGRKKVAADVVGPICESGDFLARDREDIPDASRGELLAVMSAGAYGFTMSSNYNSRPRVAEVLAKGDELFVVRERESYEELVRGESMPEGI